MLFSAFGCWAFGLVRLLLPLGQRSGRLPIHVFDIKCDRSLEEFDAAVSVHGKALEKDLLIKHHLGILYDQLLESNLTKIIQVPRRTVRSVSIRPLNRETC